jgi:hypothetical protein
VRKSFLHHAIGFREEETKGSQRRGRRELVIFPMKKDRWSLLVDAFFGRRLMRGGNGPDGQVTLAIFAILQHRTRCMRADINLLYSRKGRKGTHTTKERFRSELGRFLGRGLIKNRFLYVAISACRRRCGGRPRALPPRAPFERQSLRRP